jgi:hypothetical protein
MTVLLSAGRKGELLLCTRTREKSEMLYGCREILTPQKYRIDCDDSHEISLASALAL